MQEASQNARCDQIYYYQVDHLGTPLELLDTEGGTVWSAKYMAWGKVWQLDADEVAQPLRFQGQYFDQESGLHYNRYRYYDPEVGRFVGQDPIGLNGGENLYQYGPNPVEWVDPMGLSPTDPVALLAAERAKLGLPVAGSPCDTSTLSLLKMAGKMFFGINSGDQNPKTAITLSRVNAQTKTHAEAEATQKAVNAGMAGKADHAEMWVDRDPCGACGLPGAGGLRSLARNLGCPITVHSPSGSQTYTPTK